MTRRLRVDAVPGIGEVTPGQPLGALLARALRAARMALAAGDVLVVAQKIVSKAEGRFVDLCGVLPSAKAVELAAATGKDPRLVEVVLRESSEVLRAVPGVLIVRHRLGYVLAQGGVDRSNVPRPPGTERVLLLPEDPDASAAGIRDVLASELGIAPGVIISDSFGRPWRLGVVNVALGAAGVPALWDRRGDPDREGYALAVTEVGWADAVAAAAGLVIGEGSEGTPVALVRGLACSAPERPAAALVRARAQDLFT